MWNARVKVTPEGMGHRTPWVLRRGRLIKMAEWVKEFAPKRDNHTVKGGTLPCVVL